MFSKYVTAGSQYFREPVPLQIIFRTEMNQVISLKVY